MKLILRIMCLNPKNRINIPLIYVIVSILICSCSGGNTYKTEINVGDKRLTVNNLNYGNFFFDRMIMLDSFSLDSVKFVDDTLNYYFKDEGHDYFNDVTVIQQFQFLFQDLWTVKSNPFYMKIYYTYPKREGESEEILMIENSVENVSKDLVRFSGHIYKDLLNELYAIDKKYPETDIIDKLGFNLALAQSDIYGKEPSFFGVNVNDYFLGVLYEKMNRYDVNYLKIFKSAIVIMKNDKVISDEQAIELDQFLFRADSIMIDYLKKNKI